MDPGAPTSERGAPPAERPRSRRVTVLASADDPGGHDIVLDVAADEAIGDAIRRCGYVPRQGCRRGGCGLCAGDLVSGAIRMDYVLADRVVTRERSRGAVMLCVARPVGDVVVRLRWGRIERAPYPGPGPQGLPDHNEPPTTKGT